MIYATDGSFTGLLTAIFESYERRESPVDVQPEQACQLKLGEALHFVRTDEAKSDRVSAGITSKIGTEALERIYRAYLSESPDAGAAIVRFVRKGIRMGPKSLGWLQDPDVFRVMDLDRKVSREVHLFLGILRFRKLPGEVFLADFEPQYDVLQLVAAHFTERLSDQRWIIRDLRRGTSAWFDGSGLVFSLDPVPDPGDGIDCEADYPALWQRYFKAIAIESRRNIRLQMHFMPKRYWKHLTEKRPG